MARAAQQRSGTQRQGRVTSVPIPLGGWNTRDAISDMRPEFATVMDNFFPTRSKIVLRNGNEEHATGMGTTTPVETLMVYNGPTGSEMFAAAGGEVFDVSVAGAVGAAVVTGQTNDRWQWVNFGNGTNHYLFAMNGANTPLSYDGTTWGTMSITGPTAANLVWIQVHQNRLWFGEENSTKFWYLGVTTISGAATSFDLSGLMKEGGYIMAMGSWTRDGGSGMDDVAVFYTSQGEVILYSGIDPGTAADWVYIGTFKIGEPVGRRCLIKGGSDLIAISRAGLLPLGVVLPIDEVQQARATVTDAINPTVTQSVIDYGANFGWQAILYPQGQYILFNIPVQENETAYQYVANTVTGAWCRFLNQNANCWAVFDDDLYFGGNGGDVYKADTGRSDNGSNIEGDVQQAYSYFGAPGVYKQYKMVQPVLASNGNITPALIVNVDFQDLPPSDQPSFSGNPGSLWDVALWDVGTWGGPDSIIKDWLGAGGLGYAASLRFTVATNDLSLSWLATNYMWEPSAGSFF